jgi:modification methylase
MSDLPLDQVLQGDCLEVLADLPAESVDLIFADPPYNLQLRSELFRPNQTKVDAVDDSWDKFADFAAYDDFTEAWLAACRRVLKPTGTLWVIGSYHNIYRVGAKLQDLGFWILNDLIWTKTNPMPNFRGVRFTNAHETLLWCQKERGAPYTFHYHAMKALNGDKQMRSDWHLPLCTGKERLQVAGKKAHSTQKPEALLYRVILASSNVGEVVLDPFFGTGTTGAVARRLHRKWIGIEMDAQYIALAQERIAAVEPVSFDPDLFITPDPRKRPRLPFGELVVHELLAPGQQLYFEARDVHIARILADGALAYNGMRGSIHQVARHIRGTPGNGWQLWHYQEPESGALQPIDVLREQLRGQLVDSG